MHPIRDIDIIDYINGQASLDLVQRIDLWVNRSKDHQLVFDNIRKILGAMDGLKDFRIIEPNMAWEKIAPFLSAKRVRINEVKKNNSRNWIKPLSVAASILMIGVIAVILWKNLNTPKFTTIMTSDQGESITLEDGSKIDLGPNSKFVYPLTFEGKSERKVLLEGKGTLDIAKDATKPFVVENFGAGVQVLGTVFEIESTSASSEIENIEGKIKCFSISDTSISIIVNPGEKVSFDGTGFKKESPPPPSTKSEVKETNTKTETPKSPRTSIAPDTLEMNERGDTATTTEPTSIPIPGIPANKIFALLQEKFPGKVKKAQVFGSDLVPIPIDINIADLDELVIELEKVANIKYKKTKRGVYTFEAILPKK